MYSYSFNIRLFCLRRHTGASAYVAVGKLYALGIVETDGVYGLAYLNVAEYNTANRLGSSALEYKSGRRGATAAEPVNINVTYTGELIVVHALACVHARCIEQVFHIAELTVVHVQVAYESATVGICFYVYAALAIATVCAVLDENVPHAGRHLAANHHGVEPLETATAYYDIL